MKGAEIRERFPKSFRLLERMYDDEDGNYLFVGGDGELYVENAFDAKILPMCVTRFDTLFSLYGARSFDELEKKLDEQG